MHEKQNCPKTACFPSPHIFIFSRICTAAICYSCKDLSRGHPRRWFSTSQNGLKFAFEFTFMTLSIEHLVYIYIYIHIHNHTYILICIDDVKDLHKTCMSLSIYVSTFKHVDAMFHDVLYGCISPWSWPWVLAGWFCARRNPMSQWCNLQHQRWKLRPGVAVNWGLLIFQWFMALGKMIFKNSEVLRGKMKQDETDVLFEGVGKRRNDLCTYIWNINRHISRRFKVILRPLLPLQEGRSTPGRWCGKETWLDQGRSMLFLVGREDANVIYGEM